MDLRSPFGTKQAKHLFCSICGVHSFYKPRSHPDCYAVTVHCVDEGSITDRIVENCDGKDWEQWHAKRMAGPVTALHRPDAILLA